MPVVDSHACAAVIILAFSAAGIVHVLWMRSAVSRRFAMPIDGGTTWRGRRLFGDHKTVRGFMAMVPATALAFAAAGGARDLLPHWIASGVWPLSATELACVGAWAGFWFMAGELPNSFMKRRWGVAPGALPAFGARRVASVVIDRLDSIVVMLIALSVAVPLTWTTAALVILFGSAVHLGFSALLWLAHVKERLA